MKRVLLILAVATIGVASAESQVKKSTVEGITNFAQVETTVACAGAVKPGSVARIKNMGFASIINLRLPTEQGADIDAEAAEAKAAGITFVHIPFNGGMPDPAVADTLYQDDHGTRHSTSVHSLRQWQPRRGTVDDQTRADRQMGQ